MEKSLWQGLRFKGPRNGEQPPLAPQNGRAGTTQAGVQGCMGDCGAAAGWCGREAPSVKEGLCLGEFLVAAGLGGRGERCAQETAEFPAFPLKAQTRFLLLDIFSPGHFLLSTWSLCQPNSKAMHLSQGSLKGYQHRPWPGGRQPLLGMLGPAGAEGLPPCSPSLPPARLCSCFPWPGQQDMILASS